MFTSLFSLHIHLRSRDKSVDTTLVFSSCGQWYICGHLPVDSWIREHLIPFKCGRRTFLQFVSSNHSAYFDDHNMSLSIFSDLCCSPQDHMSTGPYLLSYYYWWIMDHEIFFNEDYENLFSLTTVYVDHTCDFHLGSLHYLSWSFLIITGTSTVYSLQFLSCKQLHLT